MWSSSLFLRSNQGSTKRETRNTNAGGRSWARKTGPLGMLCLKMRHPTTSLLLLVLCCAPLMLLLLLPPFLKRLQDLNRWYQQSESACHFALVVFLMAMLDGYRTTSSPNNLRTRSSCKKHTPSRRDVGGLQTNSLILVQAYLH
jgi:hypothetical protein